MRREYLQTSDTDALIDLGYASAVTGKTTAARKVLATLKRREEGLSSACAVGILYGALGNRNDAVTWLEKAYAERDPQLTHLKVSPRFDPLRRDARFKLLRSRVGLPE